MSYKRILEIPRAERTYWSPEAGGRTRQKVGGKWVRKFMFSPYTAKARKEYTFYADIVMLKELESPPGSGKKIKAFTVLAIVGTFLEFRNSVLSSEMTERLNAIVGAMGGGEIISVGYWRGREEREG